MLATLPEELIHQILEQALVPSSSLASAPAATSCPPSAVTPFAACAGRGKLSALLVSKQLYRIGLPLYWHTVHITSDTQCQRLLADESKACMIRSVIVDAVFAHLGEVLLACAAGGLQSLDFNLSIPEDLPSDDEDDFNFQHDVVAKFVSGLRALRGSLKNVAIRKASSTYLTVPWVQDVFDGLATENWTTLVSSVSLLDLAVRLSSSSAGTGYLVTSSISLWLVSRPDVWENIPGSWVS
jgi:hypothetical protein